MKTLRILKYVGFGILGLGFIILAVFRDNESLELH